ncbi:MAG: Dabb family protein, partial [Sphingobacteriales bacterium]
MKAFNRREFIAAASGMAAVPIIIGTTEQQKSTQLIHHVFFWLKKPGSQADRQQLIEGLKTLSGIKEVKKLIIGTPSATEQRGVVDNSY